MNPSYQRCILQWDEIYAAEASDRVPRSHDSGNAVFNEGIRWLCEKSESVLDFGCGNGSVLFFCALHGAKTHIGIDLSQAAINIAQKRSERMQEGVFDFRLGGVEQLETLASGSQDAVVLSNILDNLYPSDAEKALFECARILKAGGKALVKLNDYVTEQQIIDWKIKVIEGRLLDDGLLLWNNTDGQWRALLECFFSVERYETVYYPEHEQKNRLFLLRKVE
ncbi:MAG: class I SAM-dependent methyltransferase [Clostridiaceae bacterium]